MERFTRNSGQCQKLLKNLKNYLVYFGRTSHLSLTFLHATSHCEPTCMGASSALSYFSAFLALSIFIQVLYRRIFSSIFIQFFFFSTIPKFFNQSSSYAMMKCGYWLMQLEAPVHHHHHHHLFILSRLIFNIKINS